MADDVNISPDMIDNLVNMLKNSNNSTNNDNNSSNTGNNTDANNTSNKTDSSKDSSFDLGDILKKFASNNSDTSSNSGNSLDFETIMKIKSIMDTLNSNDNPDSKLLYSLKPYLRKSRQAKLDQYINILKISQVSKLFNRS